ncbi:MAG: helix-turn-helix domain-containing protein [Calothrix sp. C42_A2020_038]|nr:helix-turn-helix domain-containing protein [Calothrix sp. C42_A2020_038]
MTAVYSLSIPGKSAIEISQDELRTILGEIEVELHRSKVYRRALATVQKMFGESSEQAKQLFKAVGREAIGLAFHKFAQQQHKEENQPNAGSSPDLPVEAESEVTIQSETDSVNHGETSVDLSQCLTSSKFHPKFENDSQQVTKNTLSLEKIRSSAKSNSPLTWFKNKKVSKDELAKQALAQQRIEILRDIGQQLRQARELKGMSLSQLNVYTHVPVHQMEAIENGSWDSLPEEVYVRGFIRVMGNALGLNGTKLVALLPAPEPAKTIAPVWYKEQNNTGIGFDIKPMHLYVGYTALVAGAVGGLSIVSQQAEAQRQIPDSPSSFTQTLKEKQSNTKPGLQSNGQVSIGSDIAPPEAF